MHSRLSSSAVLVASIVALGCAPTNPGIVIEGLVAPTDTCEFDVDSRQLSGLLDTSSGTLMFRGAIQYVGAVVVANRMLNQGNYVYPLMADPNVWHATEAEVELRGVDSLPLGDLGLPARFRVPASGSVVSSAGGTDEPGRGVVLFDAVPAVYGDALADRVGSIVVAVRLTGTTSGNSTQQTGEFTFLVRLCAGCLADCQLDSQCAPVELDGCLSIGQDRQYQACTMAQIDSCVAAMTMM